MSRHIITNDGRKAIEKNIINKENNIQLGTVSIGNGFSSPSKSNTSLENTLYEDKIGSHNVSIYKGSNNGEIVAELTFTGGLEVSTSDEIQEVGLQTTDGNLFYREVLDEPITATYGERKTVSVTPTIDGVSDEDNAVITNNGKEFIANRLLNNVSDEIYYIGVGSGTTAVSESDTSLFTELYKGNKEQSNITIEETSDVGEIGTEIRLKAGDESDDNVPTNTTISEFGLFTESDKLVLHETTTQGITLENNDTKTFSVPLTIE